MSQTMVYSEERGTWNLFVDNEWYFEGTYEQCEEAMFNNACFESEDYNEDPYPYEDDEEVW